MVSKDTQARLASFESECWCFFSDAAHSFGMPRSWGQIYGLLYASPHPLSFSEIVAKLGISKGSTSQGLRVLHSLGAVRIVHGRHGTISGDRPTALTARRFEAELSLRILVSALLTGKIVPLATTGASRLGQLKALAKQGGDAAEFYSERVGQLMTWQRRLKTVVPILTRLLERKG